jgi:hypothetical protein
MGWRKASGEVALSMCQLRSCRIISGRVARDVDPVWGSRIGGWHRKFEIRLPCPGLGDAVDVGGAAVGAVASAPRLA